MDIRRREYTIYVCMYMYVATHIHYILCSCYLNAESSFIWSIIAPVILIFIANIGFFIMAVVIMNRHERRQNTKNRVQKIR